MPTIPIEGPAREELFARFKAGSTVFTPLDPPHYGAFNHDALDELAEIGSLLHSIEAAGEHYRMISLGAAPGEWAIKAERGYRSMHPQGDYLSVSLEGDLDHVDMTRDFMAANGADASRNILRYQVVGDRDGFAYFPVINPDVDWGAAIAAISETADDLDDKIVISDMARADRMAANGGKELEFRTVPAVSLTTLLDEVGEVNYLHCDIQGAEQDVFPGHMPALSARVRLCCIATHGRQIEATLIKAFDSAGWITEALHPCAAIGEGEDERVMKDGVFIWSNPRFF